MRYSTSEFPRTQKVARWNDIIAEVFTPLETKADSPEDFEGSVVCKQLGDIYLANVMASPATVSRLPQHAAVSRERHYFLHMQLRGRLRVMQEGREAVLDEGDLALCDSALPYSLEYRNPSDTLVMVAKPSDVRQRLPAPECVLGATLSGRQGMSHTLSLAMRSIWEQARMGLSDDIGVRVGRNLLDLFATACMDSFGERVADSAIAAARRSHIRCYIETNLCDPDLTVGSVAAAFRISPRYLHMLFVGEGETVSSYIRRRRLEECRKRLRDPMWQNRSITELAYAWGFNNTTHFARVFRERYGTSPREYRHRGREERADRSVH